MCGLVGIFNIIEDKQLLRYKAIKMAKKLRHRGPDSSGIYFNDKAILVHERLSIVDVSSGHQPLYDEKKNLILIANGEIYNYKELKYDLKDNYSFQTNSDCEVILALYKEKGLKLFDYISGIYAFALYDKEKNTFLIGRDHLGIIPLYIGYDEYKQLYIASELKVLEGICNEITEFEPGCYYYSPEPIIKKWYFKDWDKYNNVKDNISDIQKLKKGLEDAVIRQTMSEVPYGVLLSGGLDSSIISAIAKRIFDETSNDKYSSIRTNQLHSFAIGLKGAPDLIAAKKVADFIGTNHHEIHFTIEEAMDALEDVIYHIETYDVTTVRASTPMYLLARYIKSLGIKMVLSGEGSDELFGGYLYFHKAPNAKEFHEETVRKLENLHLYDCLRANKSLMAWGVEGRVPFLDQEFIDIAMNINPKDKMCGNGNIEKYILRKAFEQYLPKDILWRQKEQFSDGVGYSWIDSLKATADKKISDNQMKFAKKQFPINTPKSKEEYWFRTIFEKHFPSQAAAKTVPSIPSIACSSATALKWDKSFQNNLDPSGRAIKSIHVNAI